jgi:preprotein translocase subunit SecG
MRRSLTTLLLTVAYVAVLAQVALASGESDVGHDGGEGWVGETNDKIVTNFGFILIGAFPLIILLASLLQHRLDKRKDARKKAAKARAARADLRGGW